jgi:hypothetical protein
MTALLGSLEIALKRTRPRQRFWFYCWAGFYDGERRMSRGRSILLITIEPCFLLIFLYAAYPFSR